MATQSPGDGITAVPDGASFDKRSGNWLERAVFNHRYLFIVVCLVLTTIFGLQLTRLVVNANFDRVIPQNQTYIKNYFENRARMGGLGNTVRIVVENESGDIFSPKFLDTSRRINDDLFLLTGVDRAWMKSLWMSSVRWTEVTEEGFRGGTVMPKDYDGSPRTIEQLKQNIRAANVTGTLVGTDFKSMMYVVPLLETNPETGNRLDYGEFSRLLKEKLQDRYAGEGSGIKIHVVGFAKLVGDLIEGLKEVTAYFGIAALIASVIIYLYTRCIKSTILVLTCSIVAVVWQLGIVSALGFELDPYSILVPFLVFAIGVSHGAQKMNGIMQDVGRGIDKYIAARYTFRRLFVAGLTALLADAVGFAVLVVIDIPVIKELAVTASIGVGGLIFTNLLLLPVLLSFWGVSEKAAVRSLGESSTHGRSEGHQSLVCRLQLLTERRWAMRVVVSALVLSVVGAGLATRLKIGDLGAGAPELREDSVYNRDVAYINGHYRLSGDQFVVIVKTPSQGCEKFETLKEVEQLGWTLQQLPGVLNTVSLSDYVAAVSSGLNEGNPKWISVSRNVGLLGGAVNFVTMDSPDLVDGSCSVIPVTAYLSDHKADTLNRVVDAVEDFAAEHGTKDLEFLLAAGPAGIEAATNIVVRQSIVKMYLAVYGAVALLCFITFRSWRAVLIAIIPLVVTSILCKAIMAMLGIGLKVATLPVIALGVGIGVDYALYLLSIQLTYQRTGLSLAESYARSIEFTGKVVALVGVTLAAGVITWAWSPIKFQADMGILLTFMFLWNMIGALVMIPALSHFLLPKVNDPD